MKPERHLSRYSLLLALLACYLIPLLGLSLYGAWVPREIGDWNLLNLGWLLTACGSIILFWMLTAWEASLRSHDQILLDQQMVESEEIKNEISFEEYDLAKRSLEEAQQAQVHLLSEIDLLTEEIQRLSLTNRQMIAQSEKMQAELEQTKRVAKHQLDWHQNQIRELQEVLAEQKAFSEKKQQQMLQLETKVGDLTHEIKTLFQNEEGFDPSLQSSNKPLENFEQKELSSFEAFKESDDLALVDSHQEALRQLQQCLNIAEKIKGSQRFGSQIYSFMDSPADSFSLDLRRLCDRLRSEAQSSILLYSPKDNHLLFVSNQIKLLTGWSPDKFIQNFSEIIDEAEWKHGVNLLAMQNKVQFLLQLKTKTNQVLEVNASLGMISYGIFRNHLIGILYSSTSTF